jgi:hypothetical protein
MRTEDLQPCLYCKDQGFHGDEFTGGESYCLCPAGHALKKRERLPEGSSNEVNKRTPRELAQVAMALPNMAGPWRNVRYHTHNSRPEVEIETWERDLWGPTDRQVPLQLKHHGSYWAGWWNGMCAEGTTAEKARAAADAILSKAGYVLDNEPGPGPLRRLWEKIG